MSTGLTARDAELLARHFNTAFTTVSGYGTDHPMSARAGESLLESLKSAFSEEPAITLLLDRGALFVEKHPVGERFNPRRLLNLLAQTRIESFTFAPEVRLPDLQHLVDILAHQDRYPDVDAIIKELSKRGSRGIQINYVTYRKVTADQKVVGSEEAGSESQGGHQRPLIANDSFGSLASVMSLSELVKDPEAYAARLSEGGDDKGQRGRLVRQLRNLITQIEGGEIDQHGALNSEDLLQAVNSLREKIRRTHESNRDVEVLLSEGDQVLGEVDQLTYSTLVSLVREEYRGGSFSAKRMAQIIHRMLPDPRDLKRLLPQLKQGLLGEGMSVAEYGKLIHELSSEFRSDGLVQALEAGADSVGMDVDEIVDQIREDPAEAARLIVMATELRRAGVDDEDQLSQAFSDYIERVSERLALTTPGQEEIEAEAMSGQIQRVQRLLIDQLGRQGLPDELTRALRDRLAAIPDIKKAVGKPAEEADEPEPPLDNRDSSVSASPADSVQGLLGNPNATGPTDEISLSGLSIGSTIGAPQPSASTSAAGSTPTQKVTDTGSPLAPPPPSLPQRVLDPANTAFFLKRELKSSRRYQTPFSVLKISIEFLRDDRGRPRRPTGNDLSQLMILLYSHLIEQLRDLDLIGSLDRKLQAVPLMILPMTEQAGADIVRWRLSDLLREQVFEVDGKKVNVVASVTAVTYDFANDEDPNGFLQRLQTQHERNRAALTGSKA